MFPWVSLADLNAPATVFQRCTLSPWSWILWHAKMYSSCGMTLGVIAKLSLLVSTLFLCLWGSFLSLTLKFFEFFSLFSMRLFNFFLPGVVLLCQVLFCICVWDVQLVSPPYSSSLCNNVWNGPFLLLNVCWFLPICSLLSLSVPQPKLSSLWLRFSSHSWSG